MLNRRHFVSALSISMLSALTVNSARAAMPRVVIAGGGMAGATLAKFLRLWSNRTIDVTLVEPNATYVSNIMSNLVLTGQIAQTSLNFTYANLIKKYGIKVVKGTVTHVSDPAIGVRTVTVVAGTTTTKLLAEKVALAPGIQFEDIPRVGAGTVVPILHAWVAGPQTTLLRQQLAAMVAGGHFVMTIPKAPYRCPPGPYERACVIADYLKRTKPGSRVVVLDENPAIQAEPENFGHAFSVTYGGIIDYRPGMKVVSVSADNKTVNYKAVNALPEDPYTSLNAAVLNVIPPHKANTIVHACGLADASGFAPVDVRTFESTVPGKEGLYVLGDSSHGTGLPKAGHVGNQGAKICAGAMINSFAGLAIEPSPTANSACFSPISNTLASWLTAVYQYEPDQKKMVIKAMSNGLLVPAAPTEATAPTTANFSQMNKWYKVLMADTFA